MILGGQGYNEVTIQSGEAYTFGNGIDYNAYIFKHLLRNGGSFIVFNTYGAVTSIGDLPADMTLDKEGSNRYFKITNTTSAPVTLKYKNL